MLQAGRKQDMILYGDLLKKKCVSIPVFTWKKSDFPFSFALACYDVFGDLKKSDFPSAVTLCNTLKRSVKKVPVL